MEYMEHSNFYAMCDKIRKMEARELHLALEAHGGEFVWIIATSLILKFLTRI